MYLPIYFKTFFQSTRNYLLPWWHEKPSCRIYWCSPKENMTATGRGCFRQIEFWGLPRCFLRDETPTRYPAVSDGGVFLRGSTFRDTSIWLIGNGAFLTQGSTLEDSRGISFVMRRRHDTLQFRMEESFYEGVLSVINLSGH